MKLNVLLKNSFYIAILCVIGVFSLPLGSSIKLSFQLLAILIIYGLQKTLIEKIIVSSIYVLLGLFTPVYAGLTCGISPTFGYVIGLVVIAIPFHFLSRIEFKKDWMKVAIPSIICLIPLYLCGAIFMKFYLDISIGQSLLIGVLPYIPFDILKIIIVCLIIKRLKPLTKD